MIRILTQQTERYMGQYATRVLMQNSDTQTVCIQWIVYDHFCIIAIDLCDLQVFSLDPRLLGIRIRQGRERKGLSQDDLAIAVSKDQRAISEYENGHRKLSATDLPLFAKALNVSILYFYEDDLDIDDLDRALLIEFHRLPNLEIKQAAIGVIRVLSDTIYVGSQQAN